MNIQIAIVPLIEALRFVSINERATDEIKTTEQVLIRVKEGKVQLRTCGMEAEKTSAIFDCTASSDGEFIVCHRLFTETITNLSRRFDELFIKVNDKTISLTSGSSKSTIDRFNHPFPEQQDFNIEGCVEVQRLALLQSCRIAKITSAKQDVRYQLNGANIDVCADNYVRIVSTDGHRLSATKMKFVEEKGIQDKSIIVPNRGIDHVESFLTFIEEETVMLVVDSNYLMCRSDTGLSMKVRLISSLYPEWRRLVSSNSKFSAVINRRELIASLMAASGFSTEKVVGAKFSMSRNALKIESNNKSQGYEDSLTVECDTEDTLEIGFNIPYVLDALNSFRDDLIVLAANNASSSATITGVDTENVLMVVMPIRL